MKIAYAEKHDCYVFEAEDEKDRRQFQEDFPERSFVYPDGNRCAVPNELGLLQLMAKRGLLVPPPMVHYDWPIRAPNLPFAIQRHQANFLVLHPNAFNLSEMRTGKTLSALWAADRIMGLESCKCLIVARLSTLRRTWADAIFQNFIGRRTYEILTGSNERRCRLLDRDVDFYIVNYEGLSIGVKATDRGLTLSRFSLALSERSDIRIAILDEASAYRNATSLRSRATAKILAKTRYVWQLTGTPTAKAPTDAYGLGRLAGTVNGESFTSFRDRTMLKVSTFKWVPRLGAKEIVAQTLSPAIRFTQKDAFDAPPRTDDYVEAELSKQQRDLLRTLKRDLTLHLENGGKITAVNEAVLRTKLIQLAGGAVYDAEHKTHFIDNSPRIAEMVDIIERAPTKVLVFAPLTGILESISLSLHRLGHQHILINGKVSDTLRNRYLADFQRRDDGPRLLVAHPGPIARGLDLAAASTVIWFTPTDAPEDYQQANERINGINQTTPMAVFHIYATEVEREIYRRLRDQQSLQGSILKLLERES